jgi:hypothetical protein
MSISIRKVHARDTEFIANMSRKTFYETFAADNTKENMDHFMNNVFTKEALIKEVGMEGNYFFLAYVDNEPAGYARMRDGGKLPELTAQSAIDARIYEKFSTHVFMLGDDPQTDRLMKKNFATNGK